MQATRVQSLSDLSSASGTVALVHSGSPAYFPAMGLIEAGEAEFLGETYDDEGRQVTVRLAPARARAAAPGGEKRTITIGAEFFVTALKDYTDWPIKWWREAVQNAVDAGATKIDLGATKNDADGTWTVFCDDNGRGMDEVTILDKFLVLGGTTKIGAGGMAGGFGKAKELLLLPWIGWSVHSRATFVEGAGIDYTTTTTRERVGTRLVVVMPADKCTDGPCALEFLRRCSLPGVAFTVDGKRAKADLSGGDIVASVPGKVDLHYIKSKNREKQSDLYVRAKGLFMFSRYIGDIPGYIVAELTAPSIDLLTANRDGFRDWQVRSEVDKYAERIAKDNLSALKSHAGLIRQKFVGAGKFRARQRASDMLEQIGPQHEAAGGRITLTVTSAGTLVHTLMEFASQQASSMPDTSEAQLASLPPSDVVMAMLDQKFLGPDHLEAAVKQLVWEPDFFIVNEVENFKVPKKFFPSTMTPSVHKLAKSWTELCRYVMMQLGSSTHFGVGFVFSETMGAAAITDQDAEGQTESWLMLNPYKSATQRTDIWHPAQDADLKWLYASAIHECTHVADRISYHDESFAAALTRNVAKCADGYRKIRAIVGGIKMRGGIDVD